MKTRYIFTAAPSYKPNKYFMIIKENITSTSNSKIFASPIQDEIEHIQYTY